MDAWEVVVAKMASLSPEKLLAEWPLAANDITPPSGAGWPEGLPASEPLRRFYALCDGGHFGNCAYHLFGVGELARQTARWVRMLRDYGERGDVLVAGRHLVFGEDAAGAPLVWDSSTDRVATFWFKGGDWEPVAPSPTVFLDELFHPDPAREPEWAEAVRQKHRG